MSRAPLSLQDQRALRIMRRLIDVFELDLRGLTVMTEAATGAYAYCCVLTALAGAKHVYAVAKDTKFAPATQVIRATRSLLRRLGLEQNVEPLMEKSRLAVSSCDIFTNSSNLRPIDATMIAQMKNTAVISLMWEPWEFRKQDLDFAACRKKGILVLGTNETDAPNDLFKVPGFLALKLLYSLGLEGYKNRVMLLGGGKLGQSIHDFLQKLPVHVDWFHADGGPRNGFRQAAACWMKNGAQYDAILLAELTNPTLLIGRHGVLSPNAIAKINPSVGVGVFAGRVDARALHRAGISLMPDEIQEWGRMSYQSYHLGPLPVLQLHAAGLKVGEAMARARMSGRGVAQSAREALRHPPAMDFPGKRSWTRT